MALLAFHWPFAIGHSQAPLGGHVALHAKNLRNRTAPLPFVLGVGRQWATSWGASRATEPCSIGCLLVRETEAIASNGVSPCSKSSTKSRRSPSSSHR